VPGSPLLSPDAWRDALARCAEPTVFVVRTGDQAVRSTLAPLPVLFADRRYVAYGPCTTSTQNNNSAIRNPHSAIGVGSGVEAP
jgi:hypothetical protein